VAVGTASTKETSHDHTHHPHTRPASTVYAPGGMNLTNELAKLSLQVGRPGGVGSAAGPQDRHTAGGEEGESSHSAGGGGRAAAKLTAVAAAAADGREDILRTVRSVIG
jgi:hypothetical protein